MSLARPPADLSCADLLTTWLPDAFEKARAAGARAPDITVALVLDGKGGGAWTLRVAGGGLTVTNSADPAAHITVRQPVADFRAAIWGEGTMAPLLPADFDVAAAVTGEAKLPIAALGQMKGTLHLEIPDFAGRTFKVSATFGGGAEPSASVTADVATLEQMRAGTLQPAEAFFTGKIRVAGDVPWLMQVGLSLAGGNMM
jgi:hypothetical protein